MLRDLVGELERRRVGERAEGVEGGQLLELRPDRVGDLVAPVADVHVPERGGGIEIGLALHRPTRSIRDPWRSRPRDLPSPPCSRTLAIALSCLVLCRRGTPSLPLPAARSRRQPARSRGWSRVSTGCAARLRRHRRPPRPASRPRAAPSRARRGAPARAPAARARPVRLVGEPPHLGVDRLLCQLRGLGDPGQQRPVALGGKHRDRPDRRAHAPAPDHLPRDRRHLLEVRLRTRGDAAVDELLGDAAAQRDPRGAP